MRRPETSPGEFLLIAAEARAFAKLRRRILGTLLRQTFAHSRFRVSLVVGLTGLLWGLMLWGFCDGFAFLRATITDPEFHREAVSVIFGAFFAALMVMLSFSSGVILYGSLFRSREISLLLILPTRAERVFLHKFQDALVLSSWGFVLLGSPMLLGYGIVSRSPWYYYALLPPFVVAFVYIPVAIGAIVCLVVVRWLPGHLRAVFVGLVVAVLGAAAWMAWSVWTGPQGNLLTPDWFRDIIGRLEVADRRLLPSWWLSAGLLHTAVGAWRESVLFLALMISNALFFRQVALWTAAWTYRTAYSGLFGKTRRRAPTRRSAVDAAVSLLAVPFPAVVRLMMVKDLRLFRRDPLQWSQFLVFFGLLLLYFFNIRRFSYDMSSIAWVNLVSFLNLAVVGLLLSTFTTRFVYPMISLEGRRFWILGLLGVRRETILWSKLVFATLGSIVPCSLLVLLSDLMLNVSTTVIFTHQMTCLVLCLGLAGIAVGFGAWLPNPREQSPSRVAAGFGGTMTLVVSTIYILAIVLLTALPTHFYLLAHHAAVVREWNVPAGMARWVTTWLVSGVIGSVVLGAAATVVPLCLGFKAFRRMEF